MLKKLFIGSLRVWAVLLCGALLPVVGAEEWKSPHSLQLEVKAPVALLPFPKEVAWRGTTPLAGRDQWRLELPDTRMGLLDGWMMAETAWQALLAELPEQGKGSMVCRLVEDAKAAGGEAEGYELEVKPGEVVIRAAAEAGLFYGLQTLRQLVANGKELPLCSIRDWPAFAVRGFHHDCGRNFQSVESLKRQLDLAARLKVNYFHWHLTDHPGWHLESEKYPQLNDPKFRTRDLNDTYSLEQLREVISYAGFRNITVIPELDMPGHSSYFDKAFGFKMHSEQGMQVLEELLEEFCAAVPAAYCPIIHIGADEVKIPNAKQFVERMSNKLISLNRVPMQWGGPHDLPVGEKSISQRWVEPAYPATSLRPESIHCRTIDSTPGYTNLFDPGLLVRRWFFMRPCGVAQGDAQKLGAIICNWPDMRVDDKSLIPLHSPQWPGLCAMAERAWVGGGADGDALPVEMPSFSSEAGRAFYCFEKRMEAMRETVFRGEYFPYQTEWMMHWTVVEPQPSKDTEATRAKVLAGKLGTLQTRRAFGANLYFRTKPNTGCIGMFSQVKPGNCAWAIAEVVVEKAGEYPFMIGFDAPARSSRRCSGVPAAGEWSQCGTRIWLNGAEIKNPQVYQLAGKNRYERDTWTSPANENPLTNEEVWWAHEPTLLPLKAGRNTVIIEQPYIGEFQSWGVSLVPLFRQAVRSKWTMKIDQHK